MSARTPVNDHITDAKTGGNIKVIAAEWMALGAAIEMSLLIDLQLTGYLPDPGAANFHAPGGAAPEWRRLMKAHQQAVQDMNGAGQFVPALLPSLCPNFSALVLTFMARALAAQSA